MSQTKKLRGNDPIKRLQISTKTEQLEYYKVLGK